MVLALRIYGDFQWPPSPTPPKASELGDPRQKGVVEIHYREKFDGDGKFWPLLRWIPKEKFSPASKLPDCTLKLFDFMPNDVVALFEKNANEDFAIWIDEGEIQDLDKDWISFRGAFLLDQFQPQVGEPELNLRWPLVRSCEYISGQRVFSAVAFSRTKKQSSFRLNLHLPLPARRSTLLSAPEIDPGAFPFCVVYEPQDGAFEKILKFTTLVGGWIKGDAVDIAEANPALPSFVFGDDKYPSGSLLGQFGFAARGTPSEGKFAIYDGKQKHKTISATKFWPADSRPFTEDILGRYGFAIDAKSATWPALQQENSTTNLSLRFAMSRISEDEALTSFTYRIAVSAGASDPAASDDIKTGNGKLSIRMKPEAGGWVSTAKTLYADCRLSWNIADGDIWIEDGARWSPRADITLHWQNDIPNTASFGEKPAADAKGNWPDLDLGLLRHAAYSFAEARNALEPVEAGQPRSMLPDLMPSKQTVRFALYGTSADAHFADDAVTGVQPASGLVGWGRPPRLDGKEVPFVRPRMRLSLAKPEDLIEDSRDVSGLAPHNKLALVAKNQSFFNGAKPDIAFTLEHDTNWAVIDADEIADGEPYFASYITTIEHDPLGWSGRLSSLKFEWLPSAKGGDAPGKNEELKQTYLRIGGPGTRDGMNKALPPIDIKDGRVAASIQLVLAVSDVKPVGVDVSRMDRSGRAAPLLIQDDVANGVLGYRYWLKVSESIAPRQDRLIEANIYESAPEVGEQSYVVLSDEPFSIFRYTHRPLSDRGDVGSASVAYYSGDERIWQYRKVSDHYHYVLPPQAVGESADKPRRLEIHDLVKAADADDAQRPYVRIIRKDKNGKDEDITGEALKRRAVEFRLTPSTEFWIRPSDVERGYFMPESTSYEIFRQHGEYGLGAALAFLRGEFLYGLPVGIDVSKEETISRQARVAEIEALTGRITGPAQNVGADDALAGRWNALSRAVARRPERLEVWARDPDSSIDFTPARFANGVTYALRHSALHRPPLDKAEQTGDYGAWPKVGLLACDKAKDDDTKPRSHPQGLSGGALWPVESTNLFKTLLDSPESSGGTIESIALSPTGGDATQKVAFLGGLVTVISETRNGHVERQKVEVLGRIGALWHRAKHVVVYERTVNPSAQFAPKFEEDKDRTRSRRPILRKVREYIELIEPERSYPDFPATAARSAGFLERVRFNSKIINVDSAWSSEVGDYGWKIPLWNLLSARERPQVYPMPDVAFVTAAEGEGDNPAVSQECIDTDNLYFFSDFKAGTSDTNVWKARLDIDYANMPIAKAIAARVDRRKGSEKPDDHRRPAVTRILPGVRRFTWRLAPAAQKTAINAGRVGKPVFVGLDSVTFMRATHAGDGSKALKGNLGTILDKVAELRQPDAEPTEIAELAYWKADGTGTKVPKAEDFRKAIDGLASAIAHNSNVEDALKGLRDVWEADQFASNLATELTAAATAAGGKLAGINGLGETLKSGKEACEKLKSDAIETIQRKEMLVRTALSDWVAEADELLRKNTDTQIVKAKFIESLCDGIKAHLEPIFDGASDDVGRLQESVEKTRAILLDLETDIEAIIARARLRLEQFSAGYDRDKPWSDDRRNSFRAGLQACISNVTDDIMGSIDEARQRLAVELSDASQAVGGHIAKALGVIASLQGKVPDDVTSVKPAVTGFLKPIRETLEKLAPSGGGTGKLAALVAEVDGSTASKKLKDDAKDVITKTGEAIATLRTFAADAEKIADELDAAVAAGMNDVAAMVTALTKKVSDAVALFGSCVQASVEIAKAFSDAGFTEIDREFGGIAERFESFARLLAGQIDGCLAQISDALDPIVQSAVSWLKTSFHIVQEEVRAVHQQIDPYFEDVSNALGVVQDVLKPSALLQTVVMKRVIEPTMVQLLAPLPSQVDGDAVKEFIDYTRNRITVLSENVGDVMRSLSSNILEGVEFISSVCSAVFEDAEAVRNYINGLAGDAKAFLDKELKDAYDNFNQQFGGDLKDVSKRVESLIASVKAFDHSVRNLQNDLSRSIETARMYGDRVLDAVSRIDDGGIMAAPSNILKLYSAVSSAPEIAALKADIDRIRSGFDELSDIIETTEAGALFNKLGDELKALGLTLPFDKISDRLLPIDLSNFDIGKVFGNFGGIKLDSLFKGYKIPEGVRDAVRVTHDFDKAQARAWVQIDINAPMPGRRSLFSLGVFQADFIDIQLTAQVRLEVSKDQNKITQTGFARLGTNIDVVVAGQSMVRFDKFALNFTREKGLDIEFDPKNIHLNPSFKFIQDFLSTLFPDEVGGLKIIKQDNIPVGVEHDFVIPPMTLNFGTSGVSNISIENHFKLMAFPDFMIANRFNLSTVERPFIFSIFIIGGTGFIQIDAEYRPFDSQLMVSIEAAAGGSAALAFAIGPFVGQVYITLSGVLTYRKMIGKPGGGLSVAVVLVIAGQVEVCGIVTVGITVMLRLNYRDSGQIDGEGSLAVTIRISRFFKISAHANVNYKLRGGKSETSVSGGVSGEVTDDRLNKAKQAVEQLQKASN